MKPEAVEHNKKIIKKLLQRFENHARKKKCVDSVIPDGPVVVSCSPGKVAICWPDLEEFRFLVEHVESLGYIPGKHDHEKPLFGGPGRLRQFKKEVDTKNTKSHIKKNKKKKRRK